MKTTMPRWLIETSTRRLVGSALIVAASVLGNGRACADVGDQLAKLLADDGAEFDRFGTSVAISGTLAIVGADWNDDNGEYSGSAYIFNLSDPARPVQLAKLLPDDGAEGDGFGWRVAISGSTAIVAAYLDKPSPCCGSAYLFDLADPVRPVQLAKLLPNDGWPQDAFGISVAIFGSTAIVGAGSDDDNGPVSGSAYLFDATTGQQIAKLLPDDGAEGDRFGLRVAINGTIAIVGALRNDDNGPESGSAYLFDATTGQQIAKLLPDDGAAGDLFGRSVAISGNTVVVAAPGANSAYLFEISDPANPVQTATFVPEECGPFVLVGITGTTAIGGNLECLYLFDTTTGAPIAELVPDDPQPYGIGNSVAISGVIAIVGARSDDDNGDFAGAAYLFATSRCPSDVDGSGAVEFGDLLAVLSNWGPCVECPGDLDGNHAVGFGDLLIVLSSWGPCPEPGACCLPDGSCVQAAELDGDDCAGTGHLYQGDNTLCDNVECPQPEGACCFADGTCDILTHAACVAAAGGYQGDNWACNEATCSPGGCCLPTNDCTIATWAECQAAGGVHLGDDTTCAGVDCSEGACCLDGFGCLNTDPVACDQLGGVFQGVGTTCASASCP